ncbi:MAG: M48 family metallopeptidase [Aureispira sp.]
MNKVIPHAILGDILYKKNKRSKRITIRVKEGGKVQVTLPYYARYQQAIQVVNKHVAWIKEQLQKTAQQALQKALDWDTRLTIRTQELHLQPQEGKRLQVQENAKQLLLLVPQDWNLETVAHQQALQAGIIEVLRKAAKAYLPARTRYWAAYHHIKIENVRVKKVQTRWGSCSSKGNINLSLHLMLLPDPWIDYVICHELAHIAHPNHSAAFWAHLEELLPGAKQIDKALNQYQRPF